MKETASKIVGEFKSAAIQRQVVPGSDQWNLPKLTLILVA
jgi:hypothetical protein